MPDDAGRIWESWALFAADVQGEVDTGSNSPLEGAYEGGDATGLFWSMRLDAKEKNPAPFVKKELTRCVTLLRAEVDGRESAHLEIERHYVAPGVTVEEVGEDGIFGRLFRPPEAAPHPAVILLGGSGGGLDWDRGAAMAAHGFVTLALAYFGVGPLPPTLNDIPLEYVGKAIAWLASQQGVKADRLGVAGTSKGGELALLIGAHYPQIRAVVAFVPSAVVWRGIGKAKDGQPIHSSWMWEGKPLDFVPWQLGRFQAKSALGLLLRQPVSFRSLYTRALRNKRAVERATIPVERIQGPVLLISGGDDQVWPSAEMCEMVLHRLKQHGFRFSAEHMCCEDAGHTIRVPYTPTTVTRTKHFLPGVEVVLGGTAEANARAQSQSWERTLAFLKKHL
jgi:dienelactone hydrolase